MGDDAFLSSLKVEPQALMGFSKDSIEAFQNAIKPAMDSFGKLGLRVGGSGMPGAAYLANWNGVVVHRNSSHMMKLGEGAEALATASAAIAVIYQNSDLTASDEMAAVQDTFYPAAGTPTLEQSRAEAEQQAQQQQDAIDDEILAEASQTSLDNNGSSAAPVTSNDNVCVPADPMTTEGAQALVESQADYAGGFTPYNTYSAPTDTPMDLRDDVTGGDNIPVPVTPYYGYGYPGYYGTGYPSSSYSTSYGGSYYSASPSSSGYPTSTPTAAPPQPAPSAPTTAPSSSGSTSSAPPTSAPSSSAPQDDEEAAPTTSPSTPTPTPTPAA